MNLNLGCGNRKIEGWINADRSKECNPDVLWEAEGAWPWKTDSVDEVILNHSLEHMGETTGGFLYIIGQLYRVCKDGAKIQINVPHPRSDGFAGDPTHVRAINANVLSLFSKKNCKIWKEKGWPNTPLAEIIDVDFETVSQEYVLTEEWAIQRNMITEEELQSAISSYWNVVSEIHLELRAIKHVEYASTTEA